MGAGRRESRGSVIIWVMFWLTLLIIMIGVVINMGHVMTARGELQNGSDAAALAGALQLDGTAAQLTPAQTAVNTYAALHPTDHYQVAPSTTWLGAWTPRGRPCAPDDEPVESTQPQLFTAASKFCRVHGTDAAAAFRINAVYVEAMRTGAEGGPGGGALPLILHPLLSASSTMTSRASAIAVTGGPTQTPATVCVPMVIGIGCLTGDGAGGTECKPTDPHDTPGDMYVLGLSSTSVRSAGWSVFSSTTAPSTSNVCSYLQAGCQEVSIGDNVEVDIGQGNKFNGGCNGTDPLGDPMNNVCDWFKQYASSGATVDIPVISESGSQSEACPSTYNGQAYITGFATVKVLAVNCSTITGKNTHVDCVQAPGASYCTDATAPCSQYASTKCVLVQHICNHDDGNRSTGGSWTGTSPLKPVLVK